MKKFWINQQNKKVNVKKLIITIIILVLLITAILLSLMYVLNLGFRNWTDKNVFKKEITQENIVSLDIEENSKICAFNQYVGILKENVFSVYNSSANKECDLQIQISNPTTDSSNRFFAIAENNGNKLYLIENKNIVWENTVEGNISQIKVNKNGYVAVVMTSSSYKTVISLFNPDGEEMFKTYLSSTRTADISISNDNKYLAIAEIDTSGTLIQSNIKTISIEKAQTDPTNSVEKIYKGESNSLITNIKYQEKNKLLCMYTDSIHILDNENDEVLVSSADKKITFLSVNMQNTSIYVEEVSSGLFMADSVLNIVSSENKNISQYTTNSVTKEVYTSENVIGINTGNEIEFVNTFGWLVKKYMAEQEITNVTMSDKLACAIYRDKIEIIKF